MCTKDCAHVGKIKGNDFKSRNVEEEIFMDAEQCDTIMKSITGDRGQNSIGYLVINKLGVVVKREQLK